MSVAVRVSTRLWLLGHGVQHSPSPAMQNAALRACDLPWQYTVRDVSPDELPSVLDELRAGDAVGCNVTIPHKRAVAAACDSLEGDAAPTGAVNTVVVRDGRLVGHNTDARGFEEALRHDGLWPEPGSVAVVLGAGGAAAAVVLALTRGGIDVHVAARNPQAVENLPVKENLPVSWEARAVSRALGRRAGSLLVNATPAPLQHLPVALDAVPQDCTVVDLRYRYPPDDLVPSARARGLRTTDGLEMLLQQGMLSFHLWTGLQPPYDIARAALHQALAA